MVNYYHQTLIFFKRTLIIIFEQHQTLIINELFVGLCFSMDSDDTNE